LSSWLIMQHLYRFVLLKECFPWTSFVRRRLVKIRCIPHLQVSTAIVSDMVGWD